MDANPFRKNDLVAIRKGKKPKENADLKRLVGQILEVEDVMDVPADRRKNVDHDQRIKVRIRGEATVSEWISGGWFEHWLDNLR
jgi:hypothetical protein